MSLDVLTLHHFCNSGVAWGMVAAARGYKTIQVLPEPYSVERRAMMMSMGVEVVVTKKEDGIPGALSKYNELLAKYAPNSWTPNQMQNPVNPKAHYEHTGPEIWEQTAGRVDAVVAAYGTGGTVSGVTRFLREKNPDLSSVCS
jgi:cysteine synthase A